MFVEYNIQVKFKNGRRTFVKTYNQRVKAELENQFESLVSEVTGNYSKPTRSAKSSSKESTKHSSGAAWHKDHKYTSEQEHEKNYKRKKTPVVHYKTKAKKGAKIFQLKPFEKDMRGRFIVWNHMDGIPVTSQIFNSLNQAVKFTNDWVKRFETQGYYKDNKWNKIALSDIEVDIYKLEKGETAYTFSPYVPMPFKTGGSLNDRKYLGLFVSNLNFKGENIHWVKDEVVRATEYPGGIFIETIDPNFEAYDLLTKNKFRTNFSKFDRTLHREQFQQIKDLGIVLSEQEKRQVSTSSDNQTSMAFSGGGGVGEPMTSGNWRLVHADTNKPVMVGEQVVSDNGLKLKVLFGRPPRHSSSSGHVWEDNYGTEYYPSVFGLKWVEKFKEGGKTSNKLEYWDVKKEKEKLFDQAMEKYGVFFAFSNEQFQKNKTPLKEGDKYLDLGSGTFIPKSNYEAFDKEIDEIDATINKKIKANKLEEKEILYELENHEAFYTYDISDVVDLFEDKYTEERIKMVFDKYKRKYKTGGSVNSDVKENSYMVSGGGFSGQVVIKAKNKDQAIDKAQKKLKLVFGHIPKNHFQVRLIKKHKEGGSVENTTPSKKEVRELWHEALELHNNYYGNEGKLQYSDKEYGYLSDELEEVEVGYFKVPGDSDYAEELLAEGFNMSAQEAYDVLKHRISSIREELYHPEVRTWIEKNLDPEYHGYSLDDIPREAFSEAQWMERNALMKRFDDGTFKRGGNLKKKKSDRNIQKEVNDKTSNFLVGDEVYKIGTDPKNPFGMVKSVGKTKIYVTKHSDKKVVAIAPNKLYRGSQWQQVNTTNEYGHGGWFHFQDESKEEIERRIRRLKNMLVVVNADEKQSILDQIQADEKKLGKFSGGGVVHGEYTLKNFQFDDQTDRKEGLYSFSFELYDKQGSLVNDYEGTIQEFEDERRGNEIDWDISGVLEEWWEEAESIIEDQFVEWQFTRRKKFKEGGSVRKIVGYEVEYEKLIDGEYEPTIKSFKNKEEAEKFAEEVYGVVENVYQDQYTKWRTGGSIKKYPDLSKLPETDIVNDYQSSLPFDMPEGQISKGLKNKYKNLREVPEYDMVTTKKKVLVDDEKVSSSREAVAILMKYWDKNKIDKQEHVNVMFLNRQNQVIGLWNASQGGLASSVADRTYITSAAVQMLAQAVIIAHNHPSETMKPSQADINLTKNLQNSLSQVDIVLLDHVIVSENGKYYSFADEGKM